MNGSLIGLVVVGRLGDALQQFASGLFDLTSIPPAFGTETAVRRAREACAIRELKAHSATSKAFLYPQ